MDPGFKSTDPDRRKIPVYLNSWNGILLGKPWRQILMPSSTPLHFSWSNTCTTPKENN